MKTEIEVKIKIDEKTEITLKSEDARELYFKLKEIFGVEYFPLWTRPIYYGEPYKWTGTNNNMTITYVGGK